MKNLILTIDESEELRETGSIEVVRRGFTLHIEMVENKPQVVVIYNPYDEISLKKDPNTLDLNNTELAVLENLFDNYVMEYNEDKNVFPRVGWLSTSMELAKGMTKLTDHALSGYLSKLQEKGYIRMFTSEYKVNGKYARCIEFKEKCTEVIVWDEHWYHRKDEYKC